MIHPFAYAVFLFVDFDADVGTYGGTERAAVALFLVPVNAVVVSGLVEIL
jgi:hypothetical protein